MENEHVHECPRHPGTVLRCPKCLAAQGGKARARKYGAKERSEWARRAGKASARRKKQKVVVQ